MFSLVVDSKSADVLKVSRASRLRNNWRIGAIARYVLTCLAWIFLSSVSTLSTGRPLLEDEGTFLRLADSKSAPEATTLLSDAMLDIGVLNQPLRTRRGLQAPEMEVRRRMIALGDFPGRPNGRSWAGWVRRDWKLKREMRLVASSSEHRYLHSAREFEVP